MKALVCQGPGARGWDTVRAMVQLPAVWVLVGLTVAIFGLRPRLAWWGWVALGALVVLWTVSMSIQLGETLLNVSPFNQVPTLPGGDVTAAPLLRLVATTAALVALGVAGFRRRDTAGA